MRRLAPVLLLLAAGLTAGAADEKPVVATLRKLTPLVRVQLPGGPIQDAREGMTLPQGSQVLTLAAGQVEVRFDDGHFVRLSPNSSIVIQRLPKPGAKRTLVQLLKGRLRALIDRGEAEGDFGCYGASTVTAVKGTDYEMERTGDADDVDINDGKVDVAETKSEDPAQVEQTFQSMLAGVIGMTMVAGESLHMKRGMEFPKHAVRTPRRPGGESGPGGHPDRDAGSKGDHHGGRDGEPRNPGKGGGHEPRNPRKGGGGGMPGMPGLPF